MSLSTIFATAQDIVVNALCVPENKRGSWDKPFMFLMLGLVVLNPDMALAAPWDGPLQAFIDLLTGTTARLLAILALIVLGFMAMSGRMSWALAGSIIGGIVLVFGSAWIADMFIDSVDLS